MDYSHTIFILENILEDSFKHEPEEFEAHEQELCAAIELLSAATKKGE